MVISDTTIMNKKTSPRILIVDDNPSNILLLERLLKISGYNDIKNTTDSRDTVTLCSMYLPDLLLLDLKMPYLDGFEVMKKLSPLNLKTMSIIMISAENDKVHCEKALQNGAKDFITKPFNFQEVLLKIKSCLTV